jgi:hypothetical protein
MQKKTKNCAISCNQFVVVLSDQSLTPSTEASTISFHQLSWVDIISIGSLGPIRYFCVILRGILRILKKAQKCLQLTQGLLKFLSKKQKYC